ncbi:MAG: dTMP kinase [Ruminococcaceae bacterium]|nr:dTMP kinase [Oscillospiraceae bacterium]
MNVQPKAQENTIKNGTKGKFIVFEGIDGSGKSTQIALLEKRLKEKGINVARTAEPTASGLGGLIRDALNGTTPRTPYELASMFLADRISHNENPVYGIKKMLDEGTYVICDRYYYSSFAYQGIDADLNWVMDINLSCPQITRPDVCIFLDLDPEKSAQRISESRAFAEIFENTDTLRKIRSRFYDVFELIHQRENIRIIDAGRTVEEIADDVYAAVFEE